MFLTKQCIGESMQPTLYTGNVIITERITRKFNGLKRGDIIVATSPITPRMSICKRIIGLPGDKLILKQRIEYKSLNCAKSKSTIPEMENTNFSECDYEYFEIRTNVKECEIDAVGNQEFRCKIVYVPEGHVWIEGDNYKVSLDSRTHGPIPIGLIQGRVLGRIWPFKDIKMLT